jgi:DNA sulfur modification protein DndB
MTETKILVTKGQAGSYPVLLGSATLAQLHSISFTDHFDMDSEEGVQRPLNKSHAKEFRKYLEKGENGHKVTAPPLIFSMREEARLQNGHLVLPSNKKPLARVDCQHRLEFTGDLNVVMPFVIYMGLSKEEETSIFTTINDKHKGLTKSLVDSHSLALSKSPEEEIPHVAIAAKLNKDADSPWHDAVNTGGISKSTAGAKRIITLRTFQEANRVLICGPRCQNADFETKYNAAKNFWQAVATVFADAWADSRKHLITKGVGIAALAELGTWIVEDCLGKEDISVAAMSEHLSKLEGFNWGSKTSPLALIGGQKGARGAAKAFNAVVFGDKEVSDIPELLQPELQ